MCEEVHLFHLYMTRVAVPSTPQKTTLIDPYTHSTIHSTTHSCSCSTHPSFLPLSSFSLFLLFLIYRYVRLSAFLDALIQRVDDRLRMDAALDASSSDTGGEAVGGAVAGGKAREEAGMGMGGSGGEGAGAGAGGEGDKEGDGEGDGDRGGARGIEGMVVGAQRRWQREDRVYHGRVIDCQREVREALAQDCDTPKV